METAYLLLIQFSSVVMDLVAQDGEEGESNTTITLGGCRSDWVSGVIGDVENAIQNVTFIAVLLSVIALVAAGTLLIVAVKRKWGTEVMGWVGKVFLGILIIVWAPRVVLAIAGCG